MKNFQGKAMPRTKDIHCPMNNCPNTFKRGKRLKQNLQHHLYMSHKMEVMESHKEAERVARTA